MTRPLRPAPWRNGFWDTNAIRARFKQRFPKRWPLLLAAGIALLAASAACQAAVTSSFTAHFNVSRSGVPLGTAMFDLSSAGNGCYVYTGHAYPNIMARLLIGEITETSRFCIKNGKLRTQYFVHHIDGKPKKSYTLDFDWQNHTVVYKSDAGKRKTLNLGAQAYDPLSLQIAARRWIAGSAHPGQLADTGFPLVDGDQIKSYRLHVTDGGQVSTSGGNFDTLLVERVGNPDHQLKLWLARGADWIPVQVAQSTGGAFQMHLTHLWRADS